MFQQNVISELEGVSSCVVVSVPAPDSTGPLEPHPSVGGAQLKAFMVPVSPDSLLEGQRTLWGRMREALPAHCLPEALALVKAFPMTPHGE